MARTSPSYSVSPNTFAVFALLAGATRTGHKLRHKDLEPVWLSDVGM